MFSKLSRLPAALNQLDRTLVLRNARLRPRPAIDAVMGRLGVAANHSVVWFGISAVLASRKGPTRRAALRGMAAILGASALTNGVAKPLFPRRRPATDLVPVGRRCTAPPTSSSFPSGHAASATAFATAAAMESPAAGAAIAPLAATVAYSRVHTGVHWPSDVVCGAALGALVAAATRRWWPLRPEHAAKAEVLSSAPTAPDGTGLLVVVNPGSGNGTAEAEEWVRAHWPRARRHQLDPDRDLIADLHAALDRDESVTALGVAGGDGTVAAVASVATARGLPLAVLSAGTLNHFARDIGVEDRDAVHRAVTEGSAVAVDLSTVHVDQRPSRWFLNTASLGGYPDLVRFREKWAPRWGKWPAAGAALLRVLHESTPLTVSLNGTRRKIWVLFVGNGSYTPRGFAPSSRPSLVNGLLDVRYVRADLPFSRLRFFIAAMTGALHHSRTYVQNDHRYLDVAVHGRSVAVATDGEVGPTGNRFSFTTRAQALTAYRPERSR